MIRPAVSLRPQLPVPRGFPSLERRLLQRIFTVIGPAPVRLVLAGGQEVAPPGVTPVVTVVIQDRATLLRMLLDPEVAVGEAYAEGRLEIRGDLVAALVAVYEAWPRGRVQASRFLNVASRWLARRQANSLQGSRSNVHRHYDLGNEFYRLWLDAQMVYTCAYFPFPEATLEQAQVAKLDYVCRKLRLQPGERVVEAGCGWGALALHMARQYGVRVKAFNISHEQIVYARERAAAEGLSRRVEFIEDDWRNVTGSFDAFASIGMLEHVGLADYERMGQVIHQCLGDSGRGLLHFIGRSHKGEFSRWIRKRIFPGAYAPALREAMGILEPHNYAVVDVENLRLHYARTLEHWLARFEAAAGQVSTTHGEWFVRAWRLYLAGSIAAFRTGTLQLFQVTFAGEKCQAMDWTRASLYRNDRPASEEKSWTAAMS